MSLSRDGWRVLLFLWVLSNHNLFYMMHFITNDNINNNFSTNPLHQVTIVMHLSINRFIDVLLLSSITILVV